MSQKVEKPSLSGQRLKTRKRDEKEKYDPSAFRDALIQGLNETGADLEQVSKYLDTAKLDYRRYADVLFDVLFAGGQLAPGGSIVQDPDPTKVARTDVCVFALEEDKEKIKAFLSVFFKLIRRFKYLEKPFEDDLRKILLFLKGFSEDEHHKLAIITGLFMATGLSSPRVLDSLFQEHLVKDGIALEFATLMFRTWLAERDIGSVCQALKRSQLDSRLMELFPINKRSYELFMTHFQKAGLAELAEFQSSQKSVEVKKELQKRVAEMIKEEEAPKDIVVFLQEYLQKHNLQGQDVVILIWNVVMNSADWNKKEELVAEQALKHLKTYTPVLASVTKSSKSELGLMVKIQEYCYDNISFMKVFQKIVVLLYKTEVLSEETILKWNKDMKEAHTAKGKSVFLEQMQKFVEWLENAEEESEEEDD